jgi:lysophospholipase L1-like esterase
VIRKVVLVGLLAALWLGIAEFLLQVEIHREAGRWLSEIIHQVNHQRPDTLRSRFLDYAFAPDTQLVRPNGRRATINHLGYRGAPPTATKSGTRIVCLGGSTVFCIGVDDAKTWPVLLAKALGSGVEVLNYGVNGYHSGQSLIQTATEMSDCHPDVCCFLEGWNDLVPSTVSDLQPDYGNSGGVDSARWYFDPFSRLRVGESLALLQTARYLCGRFLLRYVGPPLGEQALDDGQVNQRALDLYARNLRLIVALCRAQGITPMMVPQKMNLALLDQDRKGTLWVEGLSGRTIATRIRAYNRKMVEICATLKVDCVSELLGANFADADFLDEGHLSAQGNARLAEIIATHYAQARSMPRQER